MKQLKKSIGITFAVILVLGSQFSECAPVSNRAGQGQRMTTRTTTTIKPTTPTPTQARAARMNCPENTERDSSDPRQAIGKHPVSRLFEIQAKNHEAAPIFKDLGQRGALNKVEFHVQVTVNNKTTSAWGHSKKDAKRRAAIELLTQMGLRVESDGSNVLNNC